MTTKKIYNPGPKNREPKHVEPQISYARLDDLSAKCSAPTNGPPPGEMDAAIWEIVGDLKGWLNKKIHSNDLNCFRSTCWTQLREILDAAVDENNPVPFDTLAKAWRETKIKSPVRRLKKGTAGSTDAWSRKKQLDDDFSANSIDRLIPLSRANLPNSPKKVLFIELIRTFQEKQEIVQKIRRAPTNREILELSKAHANKESNPAGLSADEIWRMAKEMGLKLSLEKTPKKMQ